MSQVISFPAAFHLLAQTALSPSIVMYDFVAENSRSFAVAVTSICEFSLKRRAVSFTTEKASGRISNKVFSEIS
ncbi:hypothetical protein D3C80_1651740 [compost metagenome]